ncbi:MAG: hypothetical protein IKT46_07340 [Clostridia bacterium]|nr:hypothetical protein [Clostridia bacterium]
MENFICAAIDIGTTTISAVVLDILSEKQLDSFNIENSSDIPTGHSYERIQDPKKILQLVRALIKKIYDKYPRVISMGFTGQMHGILYLDKEGNAVSPLYTWQDQRGEEYAEEMRVATGYSLSAGYGLVTHYYNMKKGLVPKDAYTFCSIMDFVLMKTAGLKRPVIHPSVAASFGLFDIKGKCFDSDALSKLGIDIALPEVTGDRVIGAYGKTRLAPAIGDNQASVFGSVRDEDGSVLVNYGTGSQVSVITDINTAQSPLEVRPYIGGRNIVCGCGLCGGYSYELLENFFSAYAKALGIEDKQYRIMDDIAQRAYDEGKEPLCVSTLFKGTRENADLRGSVMNIGTDNFTPEQLILGVDYGMAKELYDMYRFCGAGERRTLVASGNGVQKNKVLQSYLKSLFGMELKLPAKGEEAATGAAMYSFYCLDPSPETMGDAKSCIEYLGEE